VQVTPGEWFQRVDTEPDPERHGDPFAYLEQNRKALRLRVRRRYYRAARDGRLVSAPREQAPL
jgi:hypothetical protein